MKVVKSEQFERWYKKLDLTLKTQVDVRITRILVDNHFGVFKKLGNIFELKLKSGIRIYYAVVEDRIVLLLNGGNKNNKRSQSRDIALAKKIFQEYLNGK
jgi:putative addiction module killer protein